MRIRLSPHILGSDFVKTIEERSGHNLQACCQCGKCSAGRAAAGAMEVLRHQIIPVVQLGKEEDALRTDTAWYCAACLRCAARCPKGVDLARAMEALREAAMEAHDDHIVIPEMPADQLAERPHQAVVGGFRKDTRRQAWHQLRGSPEAGRAAGWVVENGLTRLPLLPWMHVPWKGAWFRCCGSGGNAGPGRRSGGAAGVELLWRHIPPDRAQTCWV